MKLHSLFCIALLAAPAWAGDVKVENAWIREPAPGQVVVGGFLDITSQKDAFLVRVESPAAGTVEMHEMSMKNGVMHMRPLDRITLPKGKTVKLEPGGLHLMLENLKHPLKAGDKVQVTLTVKTGTKSENIQIAAEVRSMMAPAARHH